MTYPIKFTHSTQVQWPMTQVYIRGDSSNQPLRQLIPIPMSMTCFDLDLLGLSPLIKGDLALTRIKRAPFMEPFDVSKKNNKGLCEDANSSFDFSRLAC